MSILFPSGFPGRRWTGGARPSECWVLGRTSSRSPSLFLHSGSLAIRRAPKPEGSGVWETQKAITPRTPSTGAARRFQHCDHGQKRVSFEPIVDVNKTLPLRSRRGPFPDQLCARRPGFQVRFLYSIIRAEEIHRFLVLPAWLEQKPRSAEMGSRRAARQRPLLADRRHLGPAVEDVRHPVSP